MHNPCDTNFVARFDSGPPLTGTGHGTPNEACNPVGFTTTAAEILLPLATGSQKCIIELMMLRTSTHRYLRDSFRAAGVKPNDMAADDYLREL